MKLGLKSLSIQMFPPCFHLPTAAATTATTTQSNNKNKNIVRLVATDGRVKIFDHPIPASDLMEQHPLHLICRSDSFFIGQKVPALSPDDTLQPGHSYYVLPAHFFARVLSFVTLSASLLNPVDRQKDAVLLRGFEIRKTGKGMLQVRMEDDEPNATMSEEMSSTRRKWRVCTSEGLEKEYEGLVGTNGLRRWKPRLETIAESCGGGGCSSESTNRRSNVLSLRRKKRALL